MGFDKYGSGESFDSCDKFGSGGFLYVPDADEAVVPGSLEEKIQKIQDLVIQEFQPVIEMCARIVQTFMDEVVSYIQPAMKEIIHYFDLILEQYPNKRIVWLALHHKKERIRKKNRNRILKWIESGGDG